MQEKILILDFGSPTTQLIGRRLRELKEYCEIVPFNKLPKEMNGVKGVILSDVAPAITDQSVFKIDLSSIKGQFPLLGIGYGAQLLAAGESAKIHYDAFRTYAQTNLASTDAKDKLLQGLQSDSQVWMAKGETVIQLSKDIQPVAITADNELAVFKIKDEKTWGVLYLPEDVRTLEGTLILDNFLSICGCKRNWTPTSFIQSTIENLKTQLGDDKVVLGLSGGVDSSVTAVLLHKAIGRNLSCIFVDHGLLRKNEFEQVLEDYKHLGLNVIGVDAKAYFYKLLKGVSEPEQKRKIIGAAFIDIFEQEAHKINGVKWLAQGTIYPDIIESLSVIGKGVKSHHNVGGLPEKMNLKLCEPLRLLFKDEVRKIGKELGMMSHLIKRHPFPGPGLAVRILGDITPEKVKLLQEADHIFVNGLREWNLYNKVWQAGAILLPVQSVGVKEGSRTYENAVALRAVTSVDAMTADWAQLPYEFLAKISNDIIQQVEGVNRVVYDISSKPPATIEWE
ncbi:MAG TPA: glutamine-hydrolyzing GMP synthase [Paludibacter sp.]|nr:MAG: GMP synthase (glutamine-hydrolyzing) [Bacteroidetes bacterium ADurb.Bin174]HQB27795.1 glutamine-hydrolyzing GMP synthase [Paludibacter sp.]